MSCMTSPAIDMLAPASTSATVRGTRVSWRNSCPRPSVSVRSATPVKTETVSRPKVNTIASSSGQVLRHQDWRRTVRPDDESARSEERRVGKGRGGGGGREQKGRRGAGQWEQGRQHTDRANRSGTGTR